jgi:hypothetical protein
MYRRFCTTAAYADGECQDKGDMLQRMWIYAGRLHRLHDNRNDAEVYGYGDLEVPRLVKMHESGGGGATISAMILRSGLSLYQTMLGLSLPTM